MDYLFRYDSPVGKLSLGSSGERLFGLWLDGQKYYADCLREGCRELDGEAAMDIPAFAQAKRWLDIYFMGRDPGFLPPLEFRMTPFRRSVCEIMLQIPYGETMTYGQIARQIAQRQGRASMSAQAVGGAVGRNSISIIVPCHRVVGADGSLTGYAGGIGKKVFLLELEGAEITI